MEPLYLEKCRLGFGYDFPDIQICFSSGLVANESENLLSS